jgi:hypothetical protein
MAFCERPRSREVPRISVGPSTKPPGCGREIVGIGRVYADKEIVTDDCHRGEQLINDYQLTVKQRLTLIEEIREDCKQSRGELFSASCE